VQLAGSGGSDRITKDLSILSLDRAIVRRLFLGYLGYFLPFYCFYLCILRITLRSQAQSNPFNVTAKTV